MIKNSIENDHFEYIICSGQLCAMKSLNELLIIDLERAPKNKKRNEIIQSLKESNENLDNSIKYLRKIYEQNAALKNAARWSSPEEAKEINFKLSRYDFLVKQFNDLKNEKKQTANDI